jgi:hypothetical protein
LESGVGKSVFSITSFFVLLPPGVPPVCLHCLMYSIRWPDFNNYSWPQRGLGCKSLGKHGIGRGKFFEGGSVEVLTGSRDLLDRSTGWRLVRVPFGKLRTGRGRDVSWRRCILRRCILIGRRVPRAHRRRQRGSVILQNLRAFLEDAKATTQILGPLLPDQKWLLGVVIGR